MDVIFDFYFFFSKFVSIYLFPASLNRREPKILVYLYIINQWVEMAPLQVNEKCMHALMVLMQDVFVVVRVCGCDENEKGAHARLYGTQAHTGTTMVQIIVAI